MCRAFQLVYNLSTLSGLRDHLQLFCRICAVLDPIWPWTMRLPSVEDFSEPRTQPKYITP